MQTINCFIPFSSKEQVAETLKGLQACEYVKNIYLLSTEKNDHALAGRS